jgi:ubiquinone/menaquinone biosynthesis C-methylase UbiE
VGPVTFIIPRIAMSGYDLFSNIYDAALATLYAEHRQLAVAALELRPGAVVLDVPCGTGQSFAALAAAVGDRGLVLGVDASAGMLRRARARSARADLVQVRLLQADAAKLDRVALESAAERALVITHLHVFLGMSVFAEMETTFEQLWDLLAPGGRCVIVDVHTPHLGLQGQLVNKLAGADIRRRFWEPLQLVANEFRRCDLPLRARHGGQIMLAQGVKH